MIKLYTIKFVKYSVIINHFNDQEFLPQALMSLVNQTYKDWELIFVDNCSDVSPKKYLKVIENNVTFIRLKKTMSLGYARNKALLACKGEL